MGRQSSQEEHLREIASALTAAAQHARANQTDGQRSRPGTELEQGSQRRLDRHGRARDPRKLTLAEGTRSLAHRNRPQLRPWWAMLATLTVGYTAALLGAMTGFQVLMTWLTAGVGAMAVFALAVIVHRKGIHQFWAGWLLTSAVLATAWASLTAFTGFDYTRLVLLVVATVAFGLPWWKYARHPYPENSLDNVHDDPATAGARLQADWQTKAACPGGPVAGATLIHLEPYEHGYSGIVQLVRGRQSLGDIQSNIAKVSTALDVNQENLIFESHPDGPPSRLRMQVVTRSPVKQTVYFDQPVYRAGRILLGPYADGIGDANFVLYTEDSMESGYVLGSKGSGKSRIIETVALSAVWATPTVVFYLDGQNGASSPLLWEHALWRAGPQEADEMLASLLSIKEYRQLYNRKHKLPGFAPSVDMPGILVIIDECHKIFTEQASPRWADLSREGRKLGIGILAASQVTTLDAFGGGAQADALRSSLVSSNGIALRTASSVQSQVFPGLKVDLMKLPRIPGFGYTVDDGDDQHRTAPFRARFLVDEKKAAERAEPFPDGVYTAEAWFAYVAPNQRLDSNSASAAGKAFAERYERAAREQAELDAMFEDGPYAPAPVANSSTAQQANAGSAAVIPFPQLESLPPLSLTPTGTLTKHSTTAGAPEGLTDAQYAVWDTVANGVGNTAEIAEILALSQRRIQIVVGELVAAGHLVKVGRGQYQVTSPAPQESHA